MYCNITEECAKCNSGGLRGNHVRLRILKTSYQTGSHLEPEIMGLNTLTPSPLTLCFVTHLMHSL